jgi:phage host-nuclease inhibitor protein Gam
MTEILDEEYQDRTANRDLPERNDEKAEELEDIALAIETLAERIKSLTEGTDAEGYAHRYVTGHMAADHFGFLGEGIAERIRKAARMLEP